MRLHAWINHERDRGESRGASEPRQDETPTFALVLQDGGALGSYQIGAYLALAERDRHPDWVAGISIGAINAAVIAGNPPEDRVDRLTALWQAISWPERPMALPPGPWHMLRNMTGHTRALLFGQPHFYVPRLLNPFPMAPASPEKVSFYDTTPMLSTLRRFADFSLINSGDTIRLSLGATNLATGNLEFFDNHRQKIGPEHVLASSSLPPPLSSNTGAGNALLGWLPFRHTPGCGDR